MLSGNLGLRPRLVYVGPSALSALRYAGVGVGGRRGSGLGEWIGLGLGVGFGSCVGTVGWWYVRWVRLG